MICVTNNTPIVLLPLQDFKQLPLIVFKKAFEELGQITSSDVITESMYIITRKMSFVYS